ncbi:conserved protein of unknown function [Cupriavidus taiwanensis]|nr:conserved protein of unknown function [Cupriavidus taiwanensis]SOZ43405.1 conserved protein of unknown function [Cupriavidus taiwanensis]
MVFGRSRVVQAKALMRYRHRRIAWVTAVHGHDFVEAPALSPGPSPASGRGEKTSGKRKSFGLARDNACERSDALRASAQDLR